MNTEYWRFSSTSKHILLQTDLIYDELRVLIINCKPNNQYASEYALTITYRKHRDNLVNSNNYSIFIVNTNYRRFTVKKMEVDI